MESDIKVTVWCTTYNHENYIKTALDSFINQVTTFKFEVIVHDDASTDNTPNIIREYELKYPEIIKPIYQIENQYQKGVWITNTFLPNVMKGKYVAFCEGDDYWTDPYKLQKQYDIMEKDDSLAMCCHKVRVLFEKGDDNSFIPSKPLSRGRYSLQDYLDYKGYPFQTSSYFVRAYAILDYCQKDLDFRRVAKIGDRPICLYMLTIGDIYYLEDTMSCYRRFLPESWSSRTHKQNNAHIEFNRRLADMMEYFDNYTGHCYDCHLGFYRGRFYYLTCQFKRLAKPECKEFMDSLTSVKRVYVRLCARFPFIVKLIKPKSSVIGSNNV